MATEKSCQMAKKQQTNNAGKNEQKETKATKEEEGFTSLP
jgi:hypothetical protein